MSCMPGRVCPKVTMDMPQMGGMISRMSLDDSLTVAKARERGMEGGRGREGGSIQGQENQLWPVDVVCLPHPAPPYLHALHTLR